MEIQTLVHITIKKFFIYDYIKAAVVVYFDQLTRASNTMVKREREISWNKQNKKEIEIS